MADKAIPKLSESGVTIGGSKTLEQFLIEQEEKETSEEYMSEGRQPLYAKPRSRIETIMRKKGGVVRIYSRREINKEHWKECIMNLQNTNISKTAKLDRAILQILLSGKEIIGKDLAVLVRQALPHVTKKTYDIRASHLTRKTDVARVVEIRRVGNNNCFKLVTPALDLTAEELHVFAYKNYQKRAEVLKRHKGLRPYFEEEKITSDPSKTEAEQPPTEPSEPIVRKTIPIGDPDVTEAINNAIQAVSKALGIDINVSGKVEIVFRLGN